MHGGEVRGEGAGRRTNCFSPWIVDLFGICGVSVAFREFLEVSDF